MPGCNGKPCTITKYFFDHYEIASSVPTDGGPQLSDADSKTALEASESWRGKMGKVGYDPQRGESFPLPQGREYFYFADRNTCDDGCSCVMNPPFVPTILPVSMEQRFEYPGVMRGGKTYTITIKASCVLWDYPGTCRPNLIKTALSTIPKHEYYAVIMEGRVPAASGRAKA